MTIQDRATLKSFFETGDVPTETQFSDLIDSFLALGDSNQSELPFGGLSLFGSENVLEQYNGANAQSSYLYNTRTDASNYERVAIRAASNVFRVETQAAGTGTARDLLFARGGADRITLDGSGIKTHSTIYPHNNGFQSLGFTSLRYLKLFIFHIDASGAIDFKNLPTSDPAVAGRLWNDAGTVKVSAG